MTMEALGEKHPSWKHSQTNSTAMLEVSHPSCQPLPKKKDTARTIIVLLRNSLYLPITLRADTRLVERAENYTDAGHNSYP